MRSAITLAWTRLRTGVISTRRLQENANTLEEMKADLVSMFVAEALSKQGYYTPAQLRSVFTLPASIAYYRTTSLAAIRPTTRCS